MPPASVITGVRRLQGKLSCSHWMGGGEDWCNYFAHFNMLSTWLCSTLTKRLHFLLQFRFALHNITSGNYSNYEAIWQYASIYLKSASHSRCWWSSRGFQINYINALGMTKQWWHPTQIISWYTWQQNEGGFGKGNKNHWPTESTPAICHPTLLSYTMEAVYRS